MKKIFISFFLLLSFCEIFSQNFSRKDSLQGGLRVERTSFDVQRYDLNITVNPDKKYIYGYNDISFKIVENTKSIQIDLFENMKVDSIVFNTQKLNYKRDNAAVFINFPENLDNNKEEKIRFYYSGYPTIAKNAPWDGGFVFSKDSNGKHFIGVAVQGTGASLWYPVKDHQSDKPDRGASIKIAAPNDLMSVSNGRFKGKVDLKNGYTRWDWEVKNAINNYNITLNIADYIHINDNHKGLDLDYYVLKNNKEKAKKHFEEVKTMLDCFQSKFGKYPFYEDGYKLVESPYLGMEHQSAIAYGNKYKKGYLGKDPTSTDIGLLFDFIIIHESGHEWFGNSITAKDIADMWLHEAFTTYAESVYIECIYGYKKAIKYLAGQRKNVLNDKPVIGIFGVNNKGSYDMYNKGAMMLNTIRHIINDDKKWWEILLEFSETYSKQIIDGKTVINFFNVKSNINLSPVFEQYLKYTSIPELEIRLDKKNTIDYRFNTDSENFKMPIVVKIDNIATTLNATNNWKSISITSSSKKPKIEIEKDKFYVNLKI